jgi:predicted ATP-binding protein involved in virulence
MQGDIELERVISTTDFSFDFIRQIQRYLPFTRTEKGVWYDARTGKETAIDDILHEYSDQLPPEITQKLVKFNSPIANSLLDSIQVHLIKEQRLFKKVLNTNAQRREFREEAVMTETIKTYAAELKDLINVFSQRSFFETQKLDSSYPLRLTSEKNILTQQEYEARYTPLKDKQEKLKSFGLYESKQEFLNYTTEDAKALSVYLKDFEIKLSVFDDLLEKLELFTEILNLRRFTYKLIQINREKGFYFRTQTGEDLELDQLSSGEQHEVVLLYELIFNVKQNVLVLIDEPEISLHVSWQKEFLSDLLRIIRLQNIQVVIATHSPAIINDRWDLVHNLQNSSL